MSDRLRASSSGTSGRRVCHYSRYALRHWRQGRRDIAMQKFSELYADLEQGGRRGMPIKRVEYFLTVLRLCETMEQAVREGLVEEMRAIEALCEEGASRHGNLDLTFYYWMTLAKAGEKQRAQRLWSRHDMTTLLEREM